VLHFELQANAAGFELNRSFDEPASGGMPASSVARARGYKRRFPA